MNIPQNILSAQTPRVRQYFLKWEPFMEKHVEFWDIPGSLDIHTQGHCERVLLHALRIADSRQDSGHVLLALSLASIFHDSRRKDNYLDTGHGDRAAEYYKEFCESGKQDISLPPFLQETYTAIKFHDRDDADGEAYIDSHAITGKEIWTEVYHVFKDADALDRLRLGTWCLDDKYLRTPESKSMIAFTQQLVEATIPTDELQQTYSMLEPFRPKDK